MQFDQSLKYFGQNLRISTKISNILKFMLVKILNYSVKISKDQHLEIYWGLYRALQVSGSLWRALEGSRALYRALEGCGRFWKTLDGSRGLWTALNGSRGL